MRRVITVWPQYLLPQKLLTAMAWKLSTCRIGWVKQGFIGLFIRLFDPNLNEARESDPRKYACFNEFFTRALKDDARPLAADNHRLISPCDGRISQLGRIDNGRIIQAKGMHFSAETLLGCQDWADDFRQGRFITIYLAPSDYHRVHMPISGQLTGERRVPGRLFSVSEATSQSINGLFARNERLIARFQTDHGPVAVVMVAAMLVSGIETVWGTPDDRRPERQVRTREPAGIALSRGAEMGRFHWGSTVIILAPDHFPGWLEGLAPGQTVRLGQPLTLADKPTTGPDPE